MDCTRFQELINDFIFDKIDYSDDLKEFLEHAKTCKSCNEELSLYYTIHRGLGDIPAPEGSEEGADTEEELDNIKSRKNIHNHFSFYDLLYNSFCLFKRKWLYLNLEA